MKNILSTFSLILLLSGGIWAQEVTELLSNNYFDNGLNSWTLHAGGSNEATINIDNSSVITGTYSAHVNVLDAYNTYPSGKIQLTQSIAGGIEEGREYSISFKIKSSQNINNCFWTIYDEPDYTAGYYAWDWVTLEANNVVSYSYNFIATDTDPSVYFAFDFAAFEMDNVELWIDDVNFVKIPQGEELISNNYFDNGTTNWQLSAIEGGTASYDINTNGHITGSNSIHVDVTNAPGFPSGRVQLTQHNLPNGLEEGELYYLTFKIEASENINQFYWTIYDDPNGLTQYYNWGQVVLKEGRVVLCSETFTAIATDPSVYLSFDFAGFEQNNVDVYIDDVHFIKLPKADELITNNSFDDGAYANGCGIDWELYVSEGSATTNVDATGIITGDNSQHINVVDAPNGYPSGKIQFRQKDNLPNGLENGEEYELSFKIKSSKNINNCFWTIYKEKNNLNDYYNWGYIILVAGQTTSYNYTFTANTTAPNAYLSFDLAALEDDNVELWIDDVHLAKKTSNESIFLPETTWDGSDIEDNVAQPDYKQSVTYTYTYDEDMQGDAPSYNLKITRVSEIDAFKNYDNDSKLLGVGPNSDRLRFDYPKDQPWNCDMTKILVGDYFVLNAETYAIEKNLHNYSTTMNDSRWSSVDPKTIYYCDGAGFYSMNVETGAVTLLKDFAYRGYNKILIGPNEGNISVNDSLVVMTESDGSWACVFNIKTKEILSDANGEIHHYFGDFDWVDWISISPLATYIVAQVIDGGNRKIVRYDLNFTNEFILANEAEHSDFAIDANGDEVLVQALYLKKYKLSDGTITLLTPNYGRVGGHISGRASISTKYGNNMRGWVLVSADRNTNPNLYRTELFELKLDGSATIRHFGHAGTSAAVTFSSFPFGCASPDGRKIAFNSDWHFLGAHNNAQYDGRAYVVEYVGGANKIASGKKVNTQLTWKLEQNYPNPFNPTTMINYTLPTDGMTKLSIYNILGQEVKVLINEHMRAGSYSTPFNGSNLSSGVYFYKLVSNNQMKIKKMMLLK